MVPERSGQADVRGGGSGAHSTLGSDGVSRHEHCSSSQKSPKHSVSETPESQCRMLARGVWPVGTRDSAMASGSRWWDAIK